MYATADPGTGGAEVAAVAEAPEAVGEADASAVTSTAAAGLELDSSALACFLLGCGGATCGWRLWFCCCCCCNEVAEVWTWHVPDDGEGSEEGDTADKGEGDERSREG